MNDLIEIEHDTDDENEVVAHGCAVVVFHATRYEPEEHCEEEAFEYNPTTHEWLCPKHNQVYDDDYDGTDYDNYDEGF